MPGIDVPDDLYERLEAFRHVAQEVLEDEMSLDFCIEVMLAYALDNMLADLVANVEPPVLLKSFQQLAAQHPEEVYAYVVDTLRRGDASLKREEARRRFGFHLRDDEPD
jgi:hypothetical protein